MIYKISTNKDGENFPDDYFTNRSLEIGEILKSNNKISVSYDHNIIYFHVHDGEELSDTELSDLKELVYNLHSLEIRFDSFFEVTLNGQTITGLNKYVNAGNGGEIYLINFKELKNNESVTDIRVINPTDDILTVKTKGELFFEGISYIEVQPKDEITFSCFKEQENGFWKIKNNVKVFYENQLQSNSEISNEKHNAIFNDDPYFTHNDIFITEGNNLKLNKSGFYKVSLEAKFRHGVIGANQNIFYPTMSLKIDGIIKHTTTDSGYKIGDNDLFIIMNKNIFIKKPSNLSIELEALFAGSGAWSDILINIEHIV